MKIDRIVTSEPVDATARRVMQRGEHYNSPKRIAKGGHWENAPPPTVPYNAVPPATRRSGTFPDLTGVRFGRFIVVGLVNLGGYRWLCRCACGRWETRRVRAIHNEANTDDCCEQCRQLKYLRRQGEQVAEGKLKPMRRPATPQKEGE